MGRSISVWEGTQRRILLVEDDHDIRTSMEGLLRDEGYDVAACEDGRDALARLASVAAPPDLIILDLMMPVMDGWQFRISQRGDPALAQIPVIVMSADVSSKAAAVDAAAYLTKPFDHELLMRTIDRVLLAFERRRLMLSSLPGGRVAGADDATARFKNAFISNVSHEIRTPLNAVLSLSQLMREGTSGPVTPEQGRYLDIIQRSGQKVLDLLSDIIDLASLEIGELELRSEEVSLASVVRGALPSLVELANSKSLGLRVEVPETLPCVRGDGHRVGQVLGQLVDNAIKFTETGSVKIRGEARGDVVAVQVSDTGIGIPEDLLGQIFEGFSQIDRRPGRRHQGAGIGLSLAARLVFSMKGEMALQSTVGAGSCFTFTLPAVMPAARVT